MILLSELNTWHIQCIHPALDKDGIARYTQKANLFLEDIWGGDVGESPSMLEVDAVKNSTITIRGTSTPAISVKFRLPTSLRPRPEEAGGLFQQSVRHFCTRIFDITADGNIRSRLGMITTRSLMGVSPQSTTFRYYWTRLFLDALVRKEAPIFKFIENADFFTSWSKGITMALAMIKRASTDGNSSRTEQFMALASQAWSALSTAAELSSREPTYEQKKKSRELTRDFIKKSKRLTGEMDKVSNLCSKGRAAGNTHISPDAEQDLLEAIMDVLETGFDLLTVNKDIFDIWQEATMKADINRKLYGGVAAGGVTAAAISAYSGASILGPLAVAAVGGILFVVSCYFHNNSSKEMKKIKNQSDKIEGGWRTYKALSEFLIYHSCFGNGSPDAIDDLRTMESIEMDDLRARLDQLGLRGPASMADFQAAIDSERIVIGERLRDMGEDPVFKEFFPRQED